MSKEKSWINTCGFGLDKRSCKKKKISTEDIIKKIPNQINALIKGLKDLRKYLELSNIDVNEDSLKYHDYSFLNIPKDIKNVFVLAYHILQVNMMAIEELQKELKTGKKEYSKKLQDIKKKFPNLLCNVQVILLSECLDYSDVTEELMSDVFKAKNAPLKIEKHFIAFRQIEASTNFLFEKFQNKNKKLKTDDHS